MINYAIYRYMTAILCIFCLYATLPSISEGAPPFSLEVKGIRIVANGYGGEEDLNPFDKSKGISLVCILSMSEGSIIQFDPGSSTIEKFQDNIGTNLPLVNEIMVESGFGVFYEFSEDQKALMFDINSQHIPGKEATSINTSGVLAVKVASATESLEHNDVVLKPGTKLKVPGITITISEVRKAGWDGDTPLRVEWQSYQDLAGIQSLQFFDSDGTEIESKIVMYGKMQELDNRINYMVKYALSKHVKQAGIVVTYWTDVKDLKLPFSIDSSVGL